MIIRWPENLPTIQFGSAFTLVDPQLRSGAGVGYEELDRNFTGVPMDFPARLMLTGDQGVEFIRFYNEDISNGTLWFEMPLLTPVAERFYFVKIMSAYRFRRVGCDMWEFSFDSQLYLRPGTHQPPSGIEP